MSDVPPGDGDDAGLTFGSIEPIEIQEEMERSFLDYAMSVIVQRALPDAPLTSRFGNAAGSTLGCMIWLS